MRTTATNGGWALELAGADLGIVADDVLSIGVGGSSCELTEYHSATRITAFCSTAAGNLDGAPTVVTASGGRGEAYVSLSTTSSSSEAMFLSAAWSDALEASVDTAIAEPAVEISVVIAEVRRRLLGLHEAWGEMTAANELDTSLVLELLPSVLSGIDGVLSRQYEARAIAARAAQMDAILLSIEDAAGSDTVAEVCLWAETVDAQALMSISQLPYSVWSSETVSTLRARLSTVQTSLANLKARLQTPQMMQARVRENFDDIQDRYENFETSYLVQARNALEAIGLPDDAIINATLPKLVAYVTSALGPFATYISTILGYMGGFTVEQGLKELQEFIIAKFEDHGLAQLKSYSRYARLVLSFLESTPLMTGVIATIGSLVEKILDFADKVLSVDDWVPNILSKIAEQFTPVTNVITLLNNLLDRFEAIGLYQEQVEEDAETLMTLSDRLTTLKAAAAAVSQELVDELAGLSGELASNLWNELMPTWMEPAIERLEGYSSAGASNMAVVSELVGNEAALLAYLQLGRQLTGVCSLESSKNSTNSTSAASDLSDAEDAIGGIFTPLHTLRTALSDILTNVDSTCLSDAECAYQTLRTLRQSTAQMATGVVYLDSIAAQSSRATQQVAEVQSVISLLNNSHEIYEVAASWQRTLWTHIDNSTFAEVLEHAPCTELAVRARYGSMLDASTFSWLDSSSCDGHPSSSFVPFASISTDTVLTTVSQSASLMGILQSAMSAKVDEVYEEIVATGDSADEIITTLVVPFLDSYETFELAVQEAITAVANASDLRDKVRNVTKVKDTMYDILEFVLTVTGYSTGSSSSRDELIYSFRAPKWMVKLANAMLAAVVPRPDCDDERVFKIDEIPGAVAEEFTTVLSEVAGFFSGVNLADLLGFPGTILSGVSRLLCFLTTGARTVNSWLQTAQDYMWQFLDFLAIGTWGSAQIPECVLPACLDEAQLSGTLYLNWLFPLRFLKFWDLSQPPLLSTGCELIDEPLTYRFTVPGLMSQLSFQSAALLQQTVEYRGGQACPTYSHLLAYSPSVNTALANCYTDGPNPAAYLARTDTQGVVQAAHSVVNSEGNTYQGNLTGLAVSQKHGVAWACGRQEENGNWFLYTFTLSELLGEETALEPCEEPIELTHTHLRADGTNRLKTCKNSQVCGQRCVLAYNPGRDPSAGHSGSDPEYDTLWVAVVDQSTDLVGDPAAAGDAEKGIYAVEYKLSSRRRLNHDTTGGLQETSASLARRRRMRHARAAHETRTSHLANRKSEARWARSQQRITQNQVEVVQRREDEERQLSAFDGISLPSSPPSSPPEVAWYTRLRARIISGFVRKIDLGLDQDLCKTAVEYIQSYAPSLATTNRSQYYASDGSLLNNYVRDPSAPMIEL